MIKSSIETRQSVRRGAVAGVAAGIFLTLMMTAMSAAGGQDIWYGMKGASAPFFGTRAMRPGFDALTVIIGLVCHFLVSAIWGALFAIVVEGWNRSLAAITGILWGFVVWIGMYYVVLPVVGLSSMVGDAPVGRAIAFHLMFSVVMTGVYLIYPAIFPRGPRLHRSIHAG
jgi:uncharacterized membrane protein YagU involved in acid resistance